jgi:YggT family protein
MLAYIVRLTFTVYTLLLFVRVIGSWFPRFARHSFMRFVAHYTDPYLGLFRRIIPPIGGVLDLSPMVAFLALQIGEQLLLGFILR